MAQVETWVGEITKEHEGDIIMGRFNILILMLVQVGKIIQMVQVEYMRFTVY